VQVFYTKDKFYLMAENANKNIRFITCPFCKGKGTIKPPYRHNELAVNKKARLAMLMRQEGYSFREIMKHFDYKSTNSVIYLLRKYEKTRKKEKQI